MKCPHCAVEIHPDFEIERLRVYGIAGGATTQEQIGGRRWFVSHMTCPACAEPIINLRGDRGTKEPIPVSRVYPSSTGRPRAPVEVPDHISEDYHEACAVLEDSAKASAALSRRCLQAVLRENGYAQKDLVKAIEAVLASNTLPSAIADNLDAIRNIGNFAAHPMKDTSTGQILPVEPEEAEWNLDVLEELFDFFYVQPEKARQKRAALNEKLQAAGKPPMK
ncbi:DUF4145 domain-containing protein [Caballeronia sp. LZ065]|uniref:DUF4145 domain-containing protein n=1 Tax=Caballeronia sp. LZ065 TaxID=3038571 RepID=UPI002861B01E|nr:DUF4145 domain-containing protein [Caballeronia sp. LZ065]MDR5778766.1 DUF4145 domain-containing protein [Caballeronia sp. LZ065]